VLVNGFLQNHRPRWNARRRFQEVQERKERLGRREPGRVMFNYPDHNFPNLGFDRVMQAL
jgi:hypothetical protein